MRKSYDEIFNTNPRISTSLAFLIGLLLTSDLTSFEQNTLGNWLMLIAQTIITNASSQATIEGRISGGIININSNEVKCAYNPFVYDINKIRDIVNRFYNVNNNDVDDMLNIINHSISELQRQINELKNKD
ncbi:MAG: hypothetical protein IJB83_04865 [Bacilli bacterium]|nr:hypothetical protein [Bacilli bacterium]